MISGHFPESTRGQTMQNHTKLGPPGRHFLRRSDAAVYIADRYGFPCSPPWLAKLAVIGGGPLCGKAGGYRVYEPSELDRGAEARIGPPQRSTSEVDPG